MNTLFFDTETTGVPLDYRASIEKSENWPRIVQIGWVLYNENMQVIGEHEFIVSPEDFDIPVGASNVHGITTEKAKTDGLPFGAVMARFMEDVSSSSRVVGHNVDFDSCMVRSEFFRRGMMEFLEKFSGIPTVCTMKSSTEYCKLPGKMGYKWPKLGELYKILFGEDMGFAHNALIDIQNTAKCYFKLVELGVIKP